MNKKYLIIFIVMILALFAFTTIKFKTNIKALESISWIKDRPLRPSCTATSTDRSSVLSVKFDPTDTTSRIPRHELVLKNLITNKELILRRNYYIDPCPFRWATSGLYAYDIVYEHSGRLMVIDEKQLNGGEIKVQYLNGLGDGFTSPDGSLYLFGTDTDEKDGFEYCPDELNYKSQSSLRLLNFQTGEVTIIKEDKTKVLDIGGWSPNSNYVLFREFTLRPHPQCPEIYGSGTGLAYVFVLNSGDVVRVPRLDITR